jgi:hypothetical protein
MAKGDPGFTSILGAPALELFPVVKSSIELAELGESTKLGKLKYV